MRRALASVTPRVLLLLVALCFVLAASALRPPSSSSSSKRPRTSALFQFLHPPSSQHQHHHQHSHSSSSSHQPISHTSLHQQRRAPPSFLALQSGPLLDYDMIHVAGDVVAGFVGGAVGVMGTIMALEVKMRQVNERSKCPYCSGSGQLTCARCYGLQKIKLRRGAEGGGEGGRIEEEPCPSCLGVGTVVCINCKGDGLAIPVMLDKKVSRDPETRLEEYGMG